MADETKDTSPDQKNDTQGAQKLIAGKYKTVEEAEAAIKEKDGLIARQGSELGTLRKQTQARATTPQADTVDDDADNEKLAQALLTRPKEVLGGIVQGLKSWTENHAYSVVNQALNMDRFLQAHPLAVKHNKLFKSLVLETDPDLSIEERMGKAHEALEAEIKAVSSEGKKNADAERKARDKTLSAVVTDDTVSDKKKATDDEAVDTPESYMAERRAQVEKLRATV